MKQRDVSPEVLIQQLTKARGEASRLNAWVEALQAVTGRGDPPELLVAVATVLRDADEVNEPAAKAAPIDGTTRTQPGPRTPERDRRAVAAQKGFEAAVQSAVNTYYSRKENNWQAPPKDPRLSLKVRCRRRGCSRQDVRIPRFMKAGDTLIEVLFCSGELAGQLCGGKLADG